MAHRLLRSGRKFGQNVVAEGLTRESAPFKVFEAQHIWRSIHTEVPFIAPRPKTFAGTLRGWSKFAQQLSKARLSAFVASTAAVGFAVGSGEKIDYAGLGWTSLGTFAASAAANTLNQIYEVKSDGQMIRTRMRPLPLGKVSRGQALAFAGIMGAGGIAILLEKANWTTAMLGLGNIGLYAGVYTPLKVVSACNTWVGAVVGAIPPLMGWSAAAGQLEPGAWLLASALYFWQMPHFLALAWLHKEDYLRGGYAMLSRYDAKGYRTASAALRNSIYMIPIGAVAVWVGTTSWAFAYEASIAAGTLATTAAVFYGNPSKKSARLLFKFSLLFLPCFMLGMLVHRTPNDHTVTLASLKEKFMGGLIQQPNSAHEDSKKASLHWAIKDFSAAPAPLLPVPLRFRCPAKAACESDVESEQTQEQTMLKPKAEPNA